MPNKIVAPVLFPLTLPGSSMQGAYQGLELIFPFLRPLRQRIPKFKGDIMGRLKPILCKMRFLEA